MKPFLLLQKQTANTLLSSVVIIGVVMTTILTMTGIISRQRQVTRQTADQYLAQSLYQLSNYHSQTFQQGRVVINGDQAVVTLNNQHQYRFKSMNTLEFTSQNE